MRIPIRFAFLLLGIAIAGGVAAFLAHLAGYPTLAIVIGGVVAAFLSAVVATAKSSD